MSNAVVYLLVFVAPAVLIKLGIQAAKAASHWSDTHHTTTLPERSLTDLAATLHRLRREYDEVEHSSLPARAVRLRALGMAYDDTLCGCCSTLGVPAPTGLPLGALDRLEAEATLAQHGLVW
ncbi:MAG: hypothetical protein M3Y77_09915 [Actinomycetota bacterium]|nr:hypothetical protein [Actinomycetota bacterium]